MPRCTTGSAQHQSLSWKAERSLWTGQAWRPEAQPTPMRTKCYLSLWTVPTAKACVLSELQSCTIRCSGANKNARDDMSI